MNFYYFAAVYMKTDYYLTQIQIDWDRRNFDFELILLQPERINEVL